MKRSVGVIILMKVAQSNKLVAVLQRRLPTDSFPNGCQVTAHGKLEEWEGEDFQLALFREVKEELGEEVAGWLYLHRDELRIVEEKKENDKHVVTFTILYPSLSSFQVMAVINKEEVSKLIYVAESDLSSVIIMDSKNAEMKKVGFPPNVIALFEDELQAVKKAFELFKS